MLLFVKQFMFFSLAFLADSETINPATQAVSIKLEANYQALPTCINQCLWDISDDDTGPLGGNLGYHIGCAPPWLNGCYCRPPTSILQAYEFITSCVSYLCSTPSPQDASSGTSLYNSYCSRALGSAFVSEVISTMANTVTSQYFYFRLSQA